MRLRYHRIIQNVEKCLKALGKGHDEKQQLIYGWGNEKSTHLCDSSYWPSTVVEWDNILIFWTSRKFKRMETGPVAITVSGPVSQQGL